MGDSERALVPEGGHGGGLVFISWAKHCELKLWEILGEFEFEENKLRESCACDIIVAGSFLQQTYLAVDWATTEKWGVNNNGGYRTRAAVGVLCSALPINQPAPCECGTLTPANAPLQ